MLQIEKHIEIKGKEGKTLALSLSSVLNDFEQRAEVKKLKKIRIFVTKNPVAVTKKILFNKVELKRHGEMREWICETTPSFSYWEKGKVPTIMLNAKEKPFTEKNYKAIRGLFAHELMHLMNKLDGIEDELEEESKKAGKKIFTFLAKHKEVPPFSRERLLGSFVRVTSTGLLYIKDILANTRAMSFGFDDELYENYKSSLSDMGEIKFTEKYIIEELKKDRKYILDNIFLTYLGLNMCWITFRMFHNIWYKDLRAMINLKVPKIMKKKGDEILEEMLQLRSGKDKKQINKILVSIQQSYFDIVQYFCKKLKKEITENFEKPPISENFY